MSTIIKLKNHPESLALAAIEFADRRAEAARRIAERIGSDDRPDQARRTLSARALREASDMLAQAASLIEAGS